MESRVAAVRRHLILGDETGIPDDIPMAWLQ